MDGSVVALIIAVIVAARVWGLPARLDALQRDLAQRLADQQKMYDELQRLRQEVVQLRETASSRPATEPLVVPPAALPVAAPMPTGPPRPAPVPPQEVRPAPVAPARWLRHQCQSRLLCLHPRQRPSPPLPRCQRQPYQHQHRYRPSNLYQPLRPNQPR